MHRSTLDGPLYKFKLNVDYLLAFTFTDITARRVYRIDHPIVALFKECAIPPPKHIELGIGIQVDKGDAGFQV